VDPPKWSLSFGVDPTALDLRTSQPGVDARVVGSLSRIWQNPGSRFSRNISLMAGFDAPRYQRDCFSCWSKVQKKYAGLTAGASVDLFRVSRFTPYLLSGAGIYYTRLDGNFEGALTPGTPIYNNSAYTFGVNGGLGIKARLGSKELFLEQTAHAFDVRHINTGVYPLSFGIRF
jgi:hypothetical protein